MIKIRRSHERGSARLSWLDSKHTFSFGEYHDRNHMGFSTLRVINEDKIKPEAGFDFHPHRDMEIISYVLEGALTHQDSLGNSAVIVPGEVQRMSAGMGIIHSEKNLSSDEFVHLLQIWILPERKGLVPGYEQKDFTKQRNSGKMTLVASRDGREGSLTLHQDASIYVLDLSMDQSYSYEISQDRMIWIQVARGSVEIKGEAIKQGDGVAISGENIFQITAKEKSELLIFDLKDRI